MLAYVLLLLLAGTIAVFLYGLFTCLHNTEYLDVLLSGIYLLFVSLPIIVNDV